MTVPPPLAEAFADAGRLVVRDVGFTDPALTVQGERWSLAVTAPWRVVAGDALEITWSSHDAADRVWELIGRRVVAVHVPGRDLAIELSGGWTIEVFSDTDTDPWVLRLPGGIYVGPLAEG